MGDIFRFLILVALYLAIWSWLARAQRRTAAKVAHLQARAAQCPPQAIRANPTIAVLHTGQIVHLNHIPAADSVAFARDWVPMLQLAPPQTYFSLYDDDPIDDGQLCTVQKDGELWHIRLKGFHYVRV